MTDYNYKQLANIDDMKLMAGGNPMKMAEVAVKAQELARIKAEHFPEEHQFLKSFGEKYVQELKEYSEANPDDVSAQVRYRLQKERLAVREKGKTSHIDYRLVKGDLRRKLQEDTLDGGDVKRAWEMAKRNSTDENRALYSQIKNKFMDGGNDE